MGGIYIRTSVVIVQDQWFNSNPVNPEGCSHVRKPPDESLYRIAREPTKLRGMRGPKRSALVEECVSLDWFMFRYVVISTVVMLVGSQDLKFRINTPWVQVPV